MQALILAAGMGKRLKHLTENNTKCMVEVGGKAIIDRAFEQLAELDLERLILVVGYHKDTLIEHIESLDFPFPIVYVDNPVYDTTNNIYSLFLARNYLLEDDTLLLESDIVFEPGVLRDLVDDPRPTLALVDKFQNWMDGTVVKLDEEDRIYRFVPNQQFKFEDIPEYYKTVNIYKFSKEFSSHYVPFLEAFSKVLGNNEYYEQVLRVTTMLKNDEMKAKRIGKKWYEIDDAQDLDIAESMFAVSDDARLMSMQERYGGYWRFPGMLDFCYLVNPFYPPQRLIDEVSANMSELFTQYPSGMRVNSLLAAKLFNVPQENIVVGNGAAELIKTFFDFAVDGTIGITRPTFDEYPHRVPEERIVAFNAPDPDFQYGVDDLISHFEGTGIRYLIFINPDNPSGNYVPKADVERLCTWCERENIRLIIDESFADFADEPDNSFFDEAFLREHPSAILIKSISKSFGVPGVRLGVAASGDQELIADMKLAVPIWNINSFGEFYLQIAEKYKSDYTHALARFRETRRRFAEKLAGIPGLHVIPSQANYFLIELTDGISSYDLTRELLIRHNLIIKDLSEKLRYTQRQYIRVAIRTDSENDRLVDAIREVLDS